MPKVIAQRSNSDIFLIQTSEDKGRIADFEEGKYWPEFNVQSIIARGYWKEYIGSETDVLDRLSQLKDEQ